MLIPIDQICADGTTRVRVKTSDLACQDYADAMAAGATFPPLVVFFNGENYWLADGFHRLEAYRSRATVEVECDVYEGTLRDALLYAVGSNATHGLPRTIEDKRRAVFLVLEDDEWGSMSDRWIAEHCTVSHPFVRKMRALLAAADLDEELPIEPEDLIADSETASLSAAPADGSAGNVSSSREEAEGGSTGNVTSWVDALVLDSNPNCDRSRSTGNVSSSPGHEFEGSTGNVSSSGDQAGGGSTGNVSSCGRADLSSGVDHCPTREPSKRIGKDGKARRAPTAATSRGDEPEGGGALEPAKPDLLIAIRVATANRFASATADQLAAFVSLSAELQLGVLAMIVAGVPLSDALERVSSMSDHVVLEPPNEAAPQVRAVDAPTVDVSGRAVPQRVRGALAEYPRIKSLLNDLRRVRARWKALLDEYQGGARQEMSPVIYESGRLERDWKQLEYAFASSLLPHAVCGYCKGEEAQCPACRGAGWLTKSKHERVPDQVRCSPLGAGAMGWWLNREQQLEAQR
jgi:hypothetical protein